MTYVFEIVPMRKRLNIHLCRYSGLVRQVGTPPPFTLISSPIYTVRLQTVQIILLTTFDGDYQKPVKTFNERVAGEEPLTGMCRFIN